MTATRSPQSPHTSATVPVLFSCDAAYLPHAAACISSLRANNPDIHFDIVLASAKPLGISQEKFLRSFATAENISIEFRVFDILSELKLPLNFHYTIEAYIRLWIGEIFPAHKRALYLDPDLIVLGSIKELWESDLKGTAVGAVPIPASDRPEILGLAPGSLYFNSGVLLFDLDRWRNQKCKERCLEHIRTHPEMLFDPDQDVLNYCLVDEWLPLPHKWNVISPFYFLSYDMKMSSLEIEKVRGEARIIHFNGHSKPWSYLCNHPRRDEYWKYIKQTEWHDLAMTDRTLLNVARDRVSRILPAPIKRAVRRVLVI